MPLENITRRAFLSSSAIATGLYMIGCHPGYTRPPEYWERMRKMAIDMTNGNDPENLVDQKIFELINFIGDTLDPRYLEQGRMWNKNKTYRMGFLEMSDIDRQSIRELDFYITEKFLTLTFMNEKIGSNFDLIERFLLENVVGELKFEHGSGYVDSETAQKLGEIYGIDVIGQGIVTLGPTSIDINARIVETERGRIIATGAVKIQNNPATSQWLRRQMQTRWKREPRERPW